MNDGLTASLYLLHHQQLSVDSLHKVKGSRPLVSRLSLMAKQALYSLAWPL